MQTVPTSQNVPLGQSASVRVVWSVTRDNSGTFGLAITSATGAFRAGDVNGPVLDTVSKALSQAKPASGSTTTFSLDETVLVPTSVIFQAQKTGAPRIAYVRSFVDCPSCASATGAITLPITSASAAGFSISRVQLRYEDGSPLLLVSRNTKLAVFADINFNGTGLLEANWELAGPATTAGEPIFRTLKTVKRYLLDGTSPVTLKSPSVPTGDAGLYLVTLRVSTPQLAFEQPVIQYSVGETEQRDKRNKY